MAVQEDYRHMRTRIVHNLITSLTGSWQNKCCCQDFRLTLPCNFMTLFIADAPYTMGNP